MVVVDRLTKYAHLLSLPYPFKESIVVSKLMEIVQNLHGIPKNI